MIMETEEALLVLRTTMTRLIFNFIMMRTDLFFEIDIEMKGSYLLNPALITVLEIPLAPLKVMC